MKFIVKIVAAMLAVAMPLTSCRHQSNTDGNGSAMLTEQNSTVKTKVELSADIVVCGGGLAGVCAAVSAARHGAKVILVQDRPMLGGNASSDMRMGIVGTKIDDTQETGILEEMQLRNFYYNPLQRYTMWDDVIYTTVISEPNIKVLLNTSVNDVVMKGKRIAAVKAWNINAYTEYTIAGTLFLDCTGDGILRLSGAKYRHGRENPEEFGETRLQEGNDAKTMGNSILIQLRKTDVEVPFIAPDWAYHFTDADFDYDVPESTIPGMKFNYKRIYKAHDNNFWWCEFGGNFHTIADANDIHFELKKIVYGIWEYMKNHPDGRAKGFELDWIGALPAKRENTRFVGPHILTEHDVVSGGHFPDVVAYGGWTLDDHHPDAFHKKGAISVEYTVPQGFGIPFGVLYSVNVPNLMFAGRDISATHMGLSATRVMATCALLGQAAGTGAAKAIEKGVDPAEVHKTYISEVQAWLEDDDVMLPYRWRTVSDLTASAKVAEEIEVIRNGIDRKWQGADNGVWVAPNENTITYSWEKPVTISGARMIFDSDLKVRSKRMRKLEATTERVEIPKMMTRGYRIEALVGEEWKTVYEENNNYLRLRKVSFEPVETQQLRLVVTKTWGAPKAHIFAFDAL